LTAGLPAVGSNLGFEAITWIPDTTLVAAGFKERPIASACAPVHPVHCAQAAHLFTHSLVRSS
ncbi:hypothetical protein ABZ578_11805, partial [Streptomyces sp. NPDC013489]